MPGADTLENDRDLLIRLGEEAGAIALSWFGKNPEVWWKENESPVSQADYAVDTFLKERLLDARPDYGWLSEETEDSPDRLETEFTFVVDPIDGTRGFINGHREWCVSLALVRGNRPVAGVLVAPVLGMTIAASQDTGVAAGRNAISVRSPADPLVMTGPRPFLAAADAITPRTIEKTKFVPSLAWRLAKVAMGDIDVALARGSARDWDLAAADLIVHEAGGRITDLAGDDLRYNCRSTRQGGIVACHAAHHDEMLDLARRAMNKQPPTANA